MEKTVTLQLHYVSWQLEKALGNLHHDYFHISDEVLEQVKNSPFLASFPFVFGFS